MGGWLRSWPLGHCSIERRDGSLTCPPCNARDRRHRERKHECEATRQGSPIRASPLARPGLSQSFGERLTAFAMVMMVIGYLVWPLVQ